MLHWTIKYYELPVLTLELMNSQARSFKVFRVSWEAFTVVASRTRPCCRENVMSCPVTSICNATDSQKLLKIHQLCILIPSNLFTDEKGEVRLWGGLRVLTVSHRRKIQQCGSHTKYRYPLDFNNASFNASKILYLSSKALPKGNKKFAN